MRGNYNVSVEEEENIRQKFKFSSHIKYNFGFDFSGSYDFFDKYSVYPLFGILNTFPYVLTYNDSTSASYFLLM